MVVYTGARVVYTIMVVGIALMISEVVVYTLVIVEPPTVLVSVTGHVVYSVSYTSVVML